jgi:hypothetical protein
MNTSALEAARLLVFTIAVAGLAAACSSSSTPAPVSVAPTQAPASQAAAPSSNGGGSISIPSLAIPSLPNQAPDLEAMLPATFCNKTLTKTSFAGTAALSNSPGFAAALQALGKTPSDVSAAAAGDFSGSADPKCDVTFFAIRIAGADPSQLQQVFEAASQQQGDTISHVNLGGKDVVKDTTKGGSTTYVVFKGDTGIGIDAKSDDIAATAIAALP